MRVIKYHVELLEPTLVTSLQGDPNSSVAYDYLPGSVLRGIFISKYLNPQSADASDDTLRRLFFDGTTRYLNGYPLDAYNRPGWPVPASWQRVKGKEREISDFAVEAQYDDQRWQPVSKPFYTLSREGVQLIQPPRNVAVHTQRTARFGRAMPEYLPDSSQTGGKGTKLLKEDEIIGAIYRYDALAAGQTFEAAIICDNDDDAGTLSALIGGRVTLGGSRSGGYGQAEIRLMTSAASDYDVAEDTDEDESTGKLIVTLRSDVLLRDARGQFAVDPELLRKVLGKHLEVELKPEGAFLGAEIVAGFNRKWRLPLPQALAVRRGSVLIFEDPDCDQTLLDALEARGIGERRAEGFGRIVFNRQRVIELTVADPPKKSSNPITISDKEAHDLATLMVKRMLRQRLDEQVLVDANNVKIINLPSNAQIANLRVLVLEALCQATPDTRKLCQSIASIGTRGSARRQFERSTTIDGEPLLDWLKRLLRCESEGPWTMADNEWKALLRISEVERSIRIGGVSAEIGDNLRLEYILRLIELVLAKAAKQHGKEN